jgi:hypothetical protein
MAALSDYLENKLVDAIFRGIPYSPPSTLYVALGSALSGDTFTEISNTANGYARVAVPCTFSNWYSTQSTLLNAPSSGTSGTTSNGIEIVFPQPTADWQQSSWWGIYDAPTGGNLMFVGNLAVTRTVLASDAPPKLLVGALQITWA